MYERLNKFMDTVCDVVTNNYPDVQINYEYNVFKNTIDFIIEKNDKHVFCLLTTLIISMRICALGWRVIFCILLTISLSRRLKMNEDDKES